MPTFLAPRKSGAHRIAAIALYRALLSQCRAVPLQDDQRNALRNITQNRFRKNLNLTSPRLVEDAFTAGYEALDHLDASAAGKNSSTLYLTTLLCQLPSSLTAPHVPTPPAPKSAAPFANSTGNTLAPRPRPLAELKGGKRKIPVLVSANRIPYLRYKKPQPQNLSLYIKARIVQRQRRHDRRWELNELDGVARSEDVWDRIVEGIRHKEDDGVEGRNGGEKAKNGDEKVKNREEKKRGKGGVREPLWQDQVVTAFRQVCRELDGEQKKNQEWATKMVGIIDRERELAEVERKERVMRKNTERRERKRERDAAGVVDGGDSKE